jgi:hypothetical protein
MKTKLSFLLIATILVTGISACSKKDDSKPTSTANLKTQQQNNTTWHDNGKKPGVEGTDYGCWGIPGSCAGETNIYSGGGQYGPVQNFLGIVAAGVPEDIVAFIQDNYSILSQLFGTYYLDGILDGTFTVQVRGGSALSTQQPVYLVILRNGIAVAVFPLTTS